MNEQPISKKSKLTIGSLIILLILFGLLAILPPEVLEALWIWMILTGG
jgi:uncharacterized membrane protein YvbJ